MLLGIGYLCRAYGIYATDPLAPGYDSVVSQLTAAIAGRSWVYWVTIGSTLAVLALSANTGFADFPRLCRLLAEDHYLPHALATRGRRLVYSSGIVTLSLVAGALLVTFGGVTDRLIPLFAVGAFLAFTMSQIGMVVHWRRIRGHPMSSAINALGAICTALALVVVLVAKFTEGAWITALVLPSLLAIFWGIHRHYSEVREATSIPSPVEPSLAVAPLVLVPIKQWDTISRKAVQFALSLSSDVVGVHVTSAADDGAAVAAQWEAAVSVPCAMRTSPVPSLAIVKSPYRTVMRPLLTYIEEVARAHPGRMLAVILPELVEAKWWHYFLHNQRATLLKALLLLHGDRQVVVINVPWYMEIDKP